MDGWLSAVRARVRYGALCPEEQRDLCGPLDEMRLVKDAHEQDTMRRAAQISARAHVRAMQLSARMLREGKDVREYHLDAELLHEFRLGGSQYPAYSSIVAAGANACVLHYRADAAPVRDGELVLIDAGCELDGYASDITRTFPANGKFTGPQRALYDLVLASQDAAVAATRAGQRFNDPHEATVKVLSQGMLDLGLLDANKVGSVDDVIEKRAYFPFYMHRTGHWLGMDVHDCGSYVEPTAGGRGERAQGPAVERAHQEPAQPHPEAGHGADHRAGHLCAAGRRRAGAVPQHRHPHRGRRHRHRNGLRADLARGAGEADEIEALMRRLSSGPAAAEAVRQAGAEAPAPHGFDHIGQPDSIGHRVLIAATRALAARPAERAIAIIRERWRARQSVPADRRASDSAPERSTTWHACPPSCTRCCTRSEARRGRSRRST